MGLNYKIMIQRSFPLLPEWWLMPENLDRGVPLIPPPVAWTLTTDASGVGWGGHAALANQPQNTLLTQGQWSQEEMLTHIKVLEMRAVVNSLGVFRDRINHCAILVESDNTSVVSHISKEGGVRSWELWQESKQLFQLAEELEITLHAIHRPGVENILADNLSRNSLDQHEWCLHTRVVKQLFLLWGQPMFDLFATPENTQLPLFCQRHLNDAFRMDWSP
jgi:ribonuclease HI